MPSVLQEEKGEKMKKKNLGPLGLLARELAVYIAFSEHQLERLLQIVLRQHLCENKNKQNEKKCEHQLESLLQIVKFMHMYIYTILVRNTYSMYMYLIYMGVQ